MKLIEGDFIQFYSPRISLKSNTAFYSLSNGFSYVWDQANPRWINITKAKEFEPKSKNVYVSVWFRDHYQAVLEWAIRFPDVTFFIGGPLFCTVLKKHHVKLHKNIIIMPGLAEDIFDKAIDLKNWKLDFPYKDNQIIYSYYIGLDCYWKKCTFCVRPKWNIEVDRRKSSYDLEPLWTAPPGTVYLSISAPTPSMLQDILPKLNYTDKIYCIFLRAGQGEYETLKNLVRNRNINMKKLMFIIGVEFPSDRMLKLMNKGITINEYIQMINFLSEISSVGLCYISGWPNLTKQDIEDAKDFFEKISLDALLRGQSMYSRLFKSTLDSETNFLNFSYTPLSQEQKKLDNKWKSLLESMSVTNLDRQKR